MRGTSNDATAATVVRTRCTNCSQLNLDSTALPLFVMLHPSLLPPPAQG
jgi:hypothetical protein